MMNLCDRCPSLVKNVFISVDTGRDLQFCQHHTNKYEAQLIAENFVLQVLTETPALV